MRSFSRHLVKVSVVAGVLHCLLAVTVSSVAMAQCVTGGNTATCTGDVSAGGSFSSPITTVNINAVTSATVGAISLNGNNSSAGGTGSTITIDNQSTVGVVVNGTNGLAGQSNGGAGNNGSNGGGLGGSGEDGGSGGAGGTININNVAGINGTNGIGIFASSKGASGGKGGNFGAAFVANGGKGGAGGAGGNVTINHSGNIVVTGTSKHGIFAESIGGDGGNGGNGEAADADGGDGGSGGIGGTVDITSDSAISTAGSFAVGVFGQSLGGQGGQGGSGKGIGASGGTGANAQPGGAVTITQSGNVTTSGNYSHGIMGLSVGGFSGSGGAAGGIFASGASSRGAGNGGNVTITGGGSIETTGAAAYGILAQSIGGGGGNGGGGGGLFTSGGSGGSGGDGGIVKVVDPSGAVRTISTTGAGSYGVLAQSIGGSGGDGGDAVSISAVASVAIGGSAGPGGAGSTVDLDFLNANTQITTQGDDAAGIVAQSIGGGGGSGGYAVSASVSTGVSISVAVGGAGGGGGAGGQVDVLNRASVATGNTTNSTGERAYGIYAQSIGGGGGRGGLAVAGSISGGTGINLSFGGSGGTGGNGSTVLVNNQGAIQTVGRGAHGIFAQSIGGGGGSGGVSIAGGLSIGSSINLGSGGDGGSGGTSSTVTVNNTGNITTGGDTAHGVLAQSVGGGGGSGGLAVAAGISSGTGVSVGLGGGGATGGNANTVTVTNDGAIITTGRSSMGLVAQSVGGGGGDGGFSLAGGFSPSGQVSVSLGGTGANGGAGGNVVLTNRNTITTSGQLAHGLLAQSVGGGGGTGGGSLGLSGSAGIAAGAVAVTLGGDGGFGNNAGTVTVNNSSQIATTGDGAHAIVAQSIGGGGGAGGWSAALSGAVGAKGAATVSVALGGTGGDGSTANTVTVTNTANLSTGGEDAYGLVAQSIGGGGGTGGFAGAGAFSFGGKNASGSVAVALGGQGGGGGNAGAVIVDHTGNVTTIGDRSYGLVAQSLGGGGGTGGGSVSLSAAVSTTGSAVSASVALGGTGGAGGTGSTVTLLSNGNITTGSQNNGEGDDAYAILAQSIGGAGGAGGFSVAGSAGWGKDKSGSVAVALGGAGGTGGTGGNVAVGGSFTGATFVADAVTGNITTTGDRAHAILAQSMGGSGGAGGFSLGISGAAASGDAKSLSAAVSLGGSGGGGGTAGDVYVTSGATIATSGTMAYGIQAQSVGGSGGSGGGSIAGSFGGSNSINPAFSMGGQGGSGSKGGAVYVTNTGSITTGSSTSSFVGQYSDGIFAQSIGGNGGAGGFSGAISFSGSDSYNASISVGGFGGTGSDGGLAQVSNEGQIVVYGEGAIGINAQSVGGGGGAGGDTGISEDIWGEQFLGDSVVGGDLTLGGAFAGGTGAKTQSFAVSIGGWGGTGGIGGTANVSNKGNIFTFGAAGHGIYAQSVGGGGGRGGISTAATAAFKASQSGSYSFAMGGWGGTGGDGGQVIVDNDGQIQTIAPGAFGIFAQSVGGGGGDGGMTRGFNLQRAASGKDTKPGKQVALVFGGVGGGGGDGKSVTVTNDGAISTTGVGAIGIFAESIGGGGGIGGDAKTSNEEMAALLENDKSSKDRFSKAFDKFKIAIGGWGGAGGKGGTVNVTNNQTLSTTGDYSTGIYAQSVGGGGGSGGKAGTGFSGDLSIGGWGASGSDGGTVSVTNNGTITTTGSVASAIWAQSVGGGGGDGGAADFGSARSARNEIIKNLRKKGFKEGIQEIAKKTFAPTIGISVGGFAGAAGDGGNVTVSNTFALGTTGDGSHGIFAQSVGGGGGTGGEAILTNVGKVGIGGMGGASGKGGNVTVTNSGSITTTGTGSYGIFAQSVGGGGGVAGDITIGIENFGVEETKLVRNFIANDSFNPTETAALDASGSPISSTFLTAFLNGGGGSLDDNGLPTSPTSSFLAGRSVLDLASSGILSGLQAAFPGVNFGSLTRQDMADYISALFNADESSFTFPTSYSFSTGAIIPFFNKPDGDGGVVVVNSSGTINVTGGTDTDTTGRAGSIGIFAQSVGGGGGIVGNTEQVSEADVGVDLNGDGDTVDVLDFQTGLAFAGTVGGDGKGGTVTVTHSGSILAPSFNGIGIFAQSVGGSGGSQVTVNVDGGTIQGGELFDDGTGNAAAIIVDGGSNNVINIAASSTILAVGEQAILGGDEVETVNSSGSVTGNVDLDVNNTRTNANPFNNNAGGVFETRTVVDLAGGTLTNAGTLNLAASSTVGTTALTGNYVQSATGNFLGDFNFGTDASDLLNVVATTGGAGGSVTVAGLVTPNLITLSRITPAETFITGTSAPTNNGMDAVDTLTVDYGVITSGNNVQLAINSVDFTPDGVRLTRNQRSAGDFFNSIINGPGSVDLGGVMAALGNVQTANDLVAILDNVHPELYAAHLLNTLYSSQRFGNQLQSCPVPSQGVAGIIREGNCLWARATGRHTRRDGSFEYSGSEETAYAVSTGIQSAIGQNWRLGAAVEYEQSDMEVSRFGESDGERFQGGAVLKYQVDDWLFSAAASGGTGWYDATRLLNITNLIPIASVANSDFRISHANLQLRAAKLLKAGRMYVKPTLDLNAFYLKMHDFDETGIGVLNLQIRDTDDWVFAATPSIEVGTQVAWQGMQLRPFARAGVTFYSTDELGVNATFAGAPTSVGTFEAVSGMDQIVGNFSAGLKVIDPKGRFDMSLGYDGRISDDVQSHSATGRISFRF